MYIQQSMSKNIEYVVYLEFFLVQMREDDSQYYNILHNIIYIRYEIGIHVSETNDCNIIIIIGYQGRISPKVLFVIHRDRVFEVLISCYTSASYFIIPIPATLTISGYILCSRTNNCIYVGVVVLMYTLYMGHFILLCILQYNMYIIIKFVETNKDSYYNIYSNNIMYGHFERN